MCKRRGLHELSGMVNGGSGFQEGFKRFQGPLKYTPKGFRSHSRGFSPGFRGVTYRNVQGRFWGFRKVPDALQVSKVFGGIT